MGRTGSNPWARELNELVLAFCGAFVFGELLLLTMEMWWIGEYGDGWKRFPFLGPGFAANVAFNDADGFERKGSFHADISGTLFLLSKMRISVFPLPQLSSEISFQRTLSPKAIRKQPWLERVGLEQRGEHIRSVDGVACGRRSITTFPTLVDEENNRVMRKPFVRRVGTISAMRSVQRDCHAGTRGSIDSRNE